MSMLLQIVLSISIAAITVFLVMLLIQARHTAASVQRFADSAAQDLHMVATDMHEVRMRVEDVSEWVRITLEEPSIVTQVVAGILRGWPGPMGQGSGTGRFLETVLTGIRSVLHLFRGRKAQRPKEGPHE